MRILVTGGAGFIGSNLVDALLRSGHEVLAIDNLSTGRIENLRPVIDHPSFRFLQASVTTRELIRIHAEWADHIYHLAAPVGVKYIMDNPVLTILDNIRGIDVVMEAANDFQKRIMVASTSEVYGRSLDFLDPSGVRKLKEEDYRIEGSTQNHRWAYANTKSTDEFLALAYHKQCGTEACVIRFFNIVGPGQVSNYGMVIPNFMESALKNEDLTVFGSGEQKRSFMHVKDAIRAVIGLVESGKGVGEVFNVGNPFEVTINELAATIIRMTGSKSKVVHIPYEVAYGKGFEDMMRRTADISKLQNALNFELEYGLESLIQDIISFRKA